MISSVHYGEIPSESLELNQGELACRLHGLCPTDGEAVSRLWSAIKGVLKCRYAYRESDVIYLSHGDGETVGIDLGFGEIVSRDLNRNFESNTAAVTMAVTIGEGVDRLLARLHLENSGDFLIADAIASAAVESLCDAVQEKILHGRNHRPRYSPGYGDVPLTVQARLLPFLNNTVSVGIRLTDSCFMLPSKSITAILALKTDD